MRVSPSPLVNRRTPESRSMTSALGSGAWLAFSMTLTSRTGALGAVVRLPSEPEPTAITAAVDNPTIVISHLAIRPPHRGRNVERARRGLQPCCAPVDGAKLPAPIPLPREARL